MPPRVSIESRTVVERLLTQHLDHPVAVRWLPPSGDSPVHVHVPGRGGRAVELLVSTTTLRVRLSRPARTVQLRGDYTDGDLLERDLARLASLVRIYLRGQGRRQPQVAHRVPHSRQSAGGAPRPQVPPSWPTLGHSRRGESGPARPECGRRACRVMRTPVHEAGMDAREPGFVHREDRG